MKYLFYPLLLVTLWIGSSSAQVAKAQTKKPYIILISGDGFRYDYPQKYNAKNLQALSATGVTAKYMIPSYPTVTHSNHYAMVTGLYPAHSGIIANSFYDPASGTNYDKADGKWFSSESIWETASKQKITTANINWVNAKTITKELKDVYQVKKVKDLSVDDRINAIKEWLNLPEEKRPHLISLYFNHTDHAGHISGPDSHEVAEAVKEIDDAIGSIVAAVKETKLPVNFIFVSDHGMTKIDDKNPLPIPATIDTSKFIITNQNSMVNLYAKNKALIPALYKNLKDGENGTYHVYMNSNFPAHLHFGGKDDKFRRVGDIILIPNWPRTFNTKPGPGMHGFDPKLREDMGATFIAWGPVFKKGLTIEPFENVEIYGLMTKILGLKPSANDGKGKLSEQVLLD